MGESLCHLVRLDVNWKFWFFFKGAQAFISLEYDNEMELYAEKREAGKRVEAAANYLTATFWNYLHDEDKYNFTYEQFTNQTDADLRLNPFNSHW